MEEELITDQHARDEAELVIGLQRLLFGLNTENFDETKETLKSSIFLLTRDRVEQLARNIFFTARFRAMQIELLSELVSFLGALTDKYENLSELKLFLLQLFFEPSFHDEFSYKETWRYFFLYHCMKRGVYSPKEIVKQILDFPESDEFNGQAHIIRAWFAPEIQEIDVEYFDRLDFVETTFVGKEENETRVFDVLTAQNLVEPLRANDWLLLKRCREFGYTVDQDIVIFIMTDDVNALQKLSASPDFDIDQIIEPSLFSRSAILQDSTTLIAFAAALGSIECFKFLLLNKASLEIETWNDLSTSLASFAVAGGNPEIVRLVEQNNCPFDTAIYVAVQYHRNNIFYWIYSKKNFEIDHSNEERYGTLLHRAAKANNVELALFCIDHGCDINRPTENRFFYFYMISLQEIKLPH